MHKRKQIISATVEAKDYCLSTLHFWDSDITSYQLLYSCWQSFHRKCKYRTFTYLIIYAFIHDYTLAIKHGYSIWSSPPSNCWPLHVSAQKLTLHRSWEAAWRIVLYLVQVQLVTTASSELSASSHTLLYHRWIILLALLWITVSWDDRSQMVGIIYMGMPLLAEEWPRWHLQAIGPIFQHLCHLAHVDTELCKFSLLNPDF